MLSSGIMSIVAPTMCSSLEATLQYARRSSSGSGQLNCWTLCDKTTSFLTDFYGIGVYLLIYGHCREIKSPPAILIALRVLNLGCKNLRSDVLAEYLAVPPGRPSISTFI